MYRHRASLACFLSHCYTCIKTLGESDILSSTIIEKLGVLLEFWKIWCWIRILAWINQSCIVVHTLLVLDGSLHYVESIPYDAVLQIFILLAWFDTVEFNRQDVLWCWFCWSIPLSIVFVWNSIIDKAISTPSCSHCIWNRCWQNHSRILPNFVLLAWLDTLEFNRLPCSNNKKYDHAVFNDRFRYQLIYIWSVYIDRALSTPWYLYCI